MLAVHRTKSGATELTESLNWVLRNCFLSVVLKEPTQCGQKTSKCGLRVFYGNEPVLILGLLVNSFKDSENEVMLGGEERQRGDTAFGYRH